MSTLRGWQLIFPSSILNEEEVRKIEALAARKGYTFFAATQGSKIRMGIVKVEKSRRHPSDAK